MTLPSLLISSLTTSTHASKSLSSAIIPQRGTLQPPGDPGRLPGGRPRSGLSPPCRGERLTSQREELLLDLALCQGPGGIAFGRRDATGQRPAVLHADHHLGRVALGKLPVEGRVGLDPDPPGEPSNPGILDPI
jgi:hypothetical protein